MYNLFWRIPGVHSYGAKNDILVPPGATISNQASIRFTGKGAANTGKIQQENQMRLLENFAGPTPPAYPTVGQTWYDTTTNQLKVCVSSAPQPEQWVAAGGGIQSTGPTDPPPANPEVGDMWLQILGTSSGILFVYTGVGRYPETNTGIGGWEQVYPTIERHAGREEYESMMALVEQLVGPASSRASGALGRAVQNIADLGKLDRTMRSAWLARLPSDVNVLASTVSEPYAPAQMASRNRAAIKINYSSFSSKDYNEFYICGFNSSSIAMEDIDGQIYINDVLVTLPRGPCYTNAIFTDGLIIWDTTGYMTNNIGAAHFYVARKIGNIWQYDNNAGPNSWVNFVPAPGMYVIGVATTVNPDPGTPGAAPGVVSATAWENAVELANASISALKIEPNSADWDRLLAAAKYALRRLDLPAGAVDDVSPMPFVNDGRQAPPELITLPVNDVRFPSQERRSNRKLGSVTMNRMFTETANVLNLGIGSRYVLAGMLGTSGTISTFAPEVYADTQATVMADAGISGGVFGQATRTTGIILRFANRDELERFFYAGHAMQLRATHTPATNTAADLNLKGLTDGYGLIRLLADRSLTMVSTATPALNGAIVAVGGVDLTASPVVVSTSTNGTATMTLTAKALNDTDIQLDFSVNAGGPTSGTFTVEWASVNDHETWSGGRVYPTVLPYVAASDLIPGNFTDSTPIQPLVIQTQPQPQSVNTGDTATFGVVATGAGPIGYQWRRNGVDIPGAISSSYTLPTTVIGDSGAIFSVVVSNPYTSVTSSDATLTVTTIAAPTIAMVPTATVLAANGGSLGTYTGSPTTISITKNGSPISNMTELFVSGGTITLNSNVGLSSNGAVYSVTLTNAGGSATGSTTITVTPRTFNLNQTNITWTDGTALNVRLATEVGSDAGISNVVITGGALPSGVTQAGVFGWVTGTPNNGGPYNFTATFYPYADQTNVTSRVFNYSGTVGPSGIQILVMTPGGSSFNLTQGTAYNWTSGNPSNNAPVLCGVYLTMSGSPRFYSPAYSLNSGSLPPGMSLVVRPDNVNLGEALALIGTPSTPGTYTANLTFWNTHTYQTQTYTFIVSAPSYIQTYTSGSYAASGFSQHTLAIAMPVTPPSYPMQITGVSVTGGALPPNTNIINSTPGEIRLNATGAQTPGTYNFTLSLTHNTSSTNPYVESFSITLT